jgi:glutathione S-transferase
MVKRPDQKAHTMDQLILHHYDFSNYSEKVRLVLGYKKLDWRSVIIPAMNPKPNLVPLTGGYRRTPVLQIGADVYCDTQLILRELDRRSPQPTLYPQPYVGFANMVAYWAENQFFRPLVLYVSGTNQGVMPAELAADRARMRGLPVPSPDSVARAARRNAPAMRIQIAWIEELLSDGREFIAGPVTTIADFAVYHTLWFITDRTERLAFELEPYRCTNAWMARLHAFGHGRPAPMADTEALRIAAAASPAPLRQSQPFPEDPALGTVVRVRANDYGQDPIEGQLVFIVADEFALKRDDPQAGEMHVHFPRLGFDLRPGNKSL